jgi:hypothetical protein
MWLHGLLLSIPWIGWMCVLATGKPVSQFDRLWLAFRDRFGLFWSQRVREQFNQAARNAAWPVKLSWRGLVLTGAERPAPADEEKILQTLRAVLQRFMPGE